MTACTLLAPAKINFYLEIVGDRPDGFHELVMIMQTVALADRIDLRLTPTPGITLHCDHPEVPTDASNLAHRAAALMHQEFQALGEGGVEITIHKHIPVGAGLAGGSTDGAAVIRGLDHLAGLNLPVATLENLCGRLGSDMPFCIQGGAALATGRGEVLTPMAVPQGNPLSLVLAKYRSLSVSTPWAYGTYRQQFHDRYLSPGPQWVDRHQAITASPLALALHQGDAAAIGQNLHNDLEKVVLPVHESVAQLRQAFAQCPSVLGTMMSGSGPTVFALCGSPESAATVAQEVQASLNNPDLEVWVTQTQPHGVALL